MAKTPSKRQKSTSFLDLPAELRNEIYHLTMRTDELFEMSFKKMPKIPNLAKVSGQVGDEASTIFYGSNVFRLKSVSATKKFINRVDHKWRPLISRLELAYRIPAPKGGKSWARWTDTLSDVNTICRYIAGVRPEAVFVIADGTTGTWTCLTEESNIVVTQGGEGWEARPNLAKDELRAAWERYTARDHFLLEAFHEA